MTSNNSGTQTSNEPAARCIACGQDRFAPFGSAHGYHVARCSNCGLGFVTNPPSPEALEQLYSENYFQNFFSSYQEREAATRGNFRRFLKHVRRYVPDGSLLELGCAYGFFLKQAQEHFSCTGYEISKAAADYARTNTKAVVNNTDYLAVADGNLYDAIVLWDVIEHLRRPDLYLAKAAQQTKSGGYLFFTTGNFDSFVAKRRGMRWRLMIPPYHLFYFTPKSARPLLQQYGYEVTNIRSVGYSRDLATMISLVWKRLRGIPPGTGATNVDSLVSRLRLHKISLYLNLYDIMMVTARKR